MVKSLQTKQLRTAGVIIIQMQHAEYSEEDAVHICCACFGSQKQLEIQRGFEVFDYASNGELDAAFFRHDVLYLLDEDLSKETVEYMFEE